MASERDRAARTASEALSDIAMWTRATFLVTAAGAGLLLLMTIGAGFVLNEYLAARRAVSESMQSVGESFRAADEARKKSEARWNAMMAEDAAGAARKPAVPIPPRIRP